MSCFYKRAASKDGLNAACKECKYKSSHDWYMRNRELCSKRGKENRLRSQFGITLDDYKRMFAEQGGVCAICGRDGVNKKQGEYPLHVDHNHETGAVRALLCHGCNVSLGHFRDNPVLLRKAADYLETYPIVF